MLSPGRRLPIPAAVCAIARQNPGSWVHWCQTVLEHHDIGHQADHSNEPRCSLTLLQRWLCRTIFPVFDRAWHSRLTSALSLLTSFRSRPRQLRILALDDLVYSREVDPENARWWGLARHGHDPCPLATEVTLLHVCSVFAPSLTCTTACLIALLSVTCCSTAVSQHMPRQMSSRVGGHTLAHDANSLRTVRAHVRFVGRVCALLPAPLCANVVPFLFSLESQCTSGL